MNATLNDVVIALNRISEQFNVEKGYKSEYDKAHKDKEPSSTLSTKEKLRYTSIARQFEKVLGISKLADTLSVLNKTLLEKEKEQEESTHALSVTLKNLNTTLSSQRKAQEEATRASHIARHRSTPTSNTSRAPEDTALTTLGKILNTLKLGALLGIIGGLSTIASTMLKVGPVYGIAQFVGKYASMGSLYLIITSAIKFINLITFPFKALYHFFAEQGPKALGKIGIFIKKADKYIAEKFPSLFKFLVRGETFSKSLSRTITLGVEMLADKFPRFFQFFEKTKSFFKPVSEILGKGSKFLLEKIPKFLFPFLGKSLKALKWLPFGLGSAISFYFAWNRFKQGDITGGFIEIASGIASLFPFAGTAISVGLDMINLYRDLSGKSAAEAAKQTSTKTWLKEKMVALGDYLAKNSENWPIFGPLIKAYNHFKEKRWSEGVDSLISIIPGVGWLKDFFKKEKTSTTENDYTGRSFSDVIKDSFNWLFDGKDSKFFDFEKSKETVLAIKEKISGLVGKIKDFVGNVVSSASEVLTGLISTNSDMSMQFINVLTKIKPSIDKASKDLQLAITSSIKEQLNALSQLEAILYMQKDILEDNRSLLREIASNTRNLSSSPPVLSNVNNTPNIREERSFTRRSYINDVRSMNAVVRESLA